MFENSFRCRSSAQFRACYVAVVLYVVGMVLIGAAFQNHLTIAAFIIGWGLVEIATMVNTVAVCEPRPVVLYSVSSHELLPQTHTSTTVSQVFR